MRKSIACLTIGLLGVALGACGVASGGAGASDERPQVVTALYPLTFAVERIAGEHVEVTSLTPAGAEPHALELSPSQVGALSDADLVVYVGGGFQPAVSDAVAELEPDRRLDVLDGVDTIEPEGEEVDPHVWLAPSLFMEVADDIADRLVTIDPDNAEDYEAAAGALGVHLEALDEEMRAGLQSCERRAIVVSHEAFGYLTEEYDLRQIGIAGIDPEAEPTPARLAEIGDFAEEHGVTTIFFEELVSPEIAETLAAELGIETDVLSPLESAPADGDYLTAMRSNLQALRRALDCR